MSKQTQTRRNALNWKKRIAAPLAAAGLLAPVGVALSAAPSEAATSVSAARQVLYLVNVQRAKVGCKPLVGDSRLQTAATLHSQDMVARNYFSHTSRDGRTFVTRIRAQGYTGTRLGENIAAGQVNSQRVVAAWMASPGHRANILNCRYTSMGLGYAYGGAYGIYWTQDFGAPS